MYTLLQRVLLTVLGAISGVVLSGLTLYVLSTLSQENSFQDTVTGLATCLFYSYVWGTLFIITVHAIDAFRKKPRKIWYLFGEGFWLNLPVSICFILGLIAPYYFLRVTVFDYLAQVLAGETDL